MLWGSLGVGGLFFGEKAKIKRVVFWLFLVELLGYLPNLVLFLPSGKEYLDIAEAQGPTNLIIVIRWVGPMLFLGLVLLQLEQEGSFGVGIFEKIVEIEGMVRGVG